MLNRFSVLCFASLVSVGASTAMAAPAPILPGSLLPDTHLTYVRGGGGGGGHGGGGFGGGSHMGGGGYGGGGHIGGGGARFAGGPRHGATMHHGGYYGGYRRGGVFIWDYDPGWWSCYYGDRYDGWVCPGY